MTPGPMKVRMEFSKREHINQLMCFISHLFQDRNAILADKEMDKELRDIELERYHFAIYAAAKPNEYLFEDGRKIFPEQAVCFDDLEQIIDIYETSAD